LTKKQLALYYERCGRKIGWIAKELGENPDTIVGWINEQRRANAQPKPRKAPKRRRRM